MVENSAINIWFYKEHSKIKSTYLKIYKIVFKFTLPVLWIIVSFFISKQILNSIYLQNISIFPDKDINQIQKDNLIKNFDEQMNQTINNKDIQIDIIQWKFYTQWDFIYSKDNLIYYKWFIIPKVFVIQKTAPINEIEYFEDPEYDVKNLETLIENLIFSKKQEVNIKVEKNRQLFLDSDIKKTFNLACLFENRLTEKTCEYYLDNFLKYFYIYDIDKDINWLKDINNILNWWEHQKEFCENIKKYIIYSNDNKSDLKEIIKDCWSKEKEDNYNKIIEFIEIQKELDENFISDKIYAYKELNTYKLLSYQQIIYDDINSNRIDYIKLNNYLSFLKTLLKENHLEQFYKDEIYRFNNYFILVKLEKTKKQDFSKSIKDIYLINKWDRVFGLIWLSNQIKNQKLKNYWINTEEDHNSAEDMSWSKIIDTLLKSLDNISYFSIVKKDIIDDQTIKLVWYFNIKEDLIKTNMTLKKEQNSLIIKEIDLENYSTLTKVVDNLAKTNWWWINKIYQYILDNIDTYWKEDEEKTITSIWICEILETKIDKRDIIECSANKILIEKVWTSYSFSIEKNNINKIIISNNTINDTINQNLQTIIKDTSIVDSIVKIINYKEIEETQQDEWNQNIIIASEKFKKYIWDPIAVIESKWSIFIEFKLKEISFIWEFDLNTNSFKALYFKDIISDWKPLDIKNFSLSLDDDNKTTINQFVIDPINYIKGIDSFGYINYQNKFWEK